MFITSQKDVQSEAFAMHNSKTEISDEIKLAAWMEAFDAIGIGAFILGRSNRITFSNKTFQLMAWDSKFNLHGQDMCLMLSEMFGKSFAGKIAACIDFSLNNSQTLQIKTRINGKEKTYSISVHQIPGGTECRASRAVLFQDITDYVQQLTALEHQASRDPLTGIPNHWMFDQLLEKSIGVATRAGSQLHVVYLDLNNFKQINDSHGHQFGDRVLQSIAEQFQTCLRKGDTAARVGGDEFALILHGTTNPIEQVLERIQKTLRTDIRISGQHLPVEFSFGVSTFPQDGITSQCLLEIADQRMYAQKKFS